MDDRIVRDEELWKKIKTSLLAAMGIFVLTIAIGILNAVDLVEFTHAELLFHLHSGTIGWISFSAVSLLVWFYTMDRDLDEKTSRMAKNLLRYLHIVIPTYVLLFYLGFALAEGDDLLRIIPAGNGSRWYYVLLVAGAIAATFGFIWAVYFAISELKNIEKKTAPHYLFLGALTTSSYGGIFGMILEIQNLLGESFFDFDKGQSGGAAHAAAMEVGYLYMIIVAIVEWQGLGKNMEEITRSGYIEAFSLFFAGFAVSFGAGFNIVPLVALNLPFMLIGVGLFIKRVVMNLEWKKVSQKGPELYYLTATVFMLFSVGVFLYLVFTFITGDDITDLFESPFFGGLFLANNHSLFIGGVTSSIFGCLAAMYYSEKDKLQRFENIGVIFMYVGLIGFMFVLVYRGLLSEDGRNDEAADIRTDIASLMGIGLFMVMYSFFTRYRNTQPKI